MKKFTVTLTEAELRALIAASRSAYVDAKFQDPVDTAFDALLKALHSDEVV